MASDPRPHAPGPRSRSAAARRTLGWLSLLLAVVAAVAVLFGARKVARDPVLRRRTRRRIEDAWITTKDATYHQRQRLRRKRQLLEKELTDLVDAIGDRLDDLPLFPVRPRMPPVPRRFYAHGAFMGAAPALLDDPRWRSILAFLMPDVYRDVRAAVRAGARFDSVIPMFANNPVMAAYGMWRSAGTGHDDAEHLDGLEWDLYLPGHLVDAWEETQDPHRRALVTAEIAQTMLVAHASTTDTLQEQIGLCQWADVRRTPKSRLGGVEAGAWLDLYGRALALASATDLPAALAAMRGDERSGSALECHRFTFVHRTPPQEVARLHRALTGAHLSIVLEIKSLRSTPMLLSALVAELNRWHVRVIAVASFLVEEFRGLSAIAQRIAGEDLPGPREVLLLHMAGDLQAACDHGRVPAGSTAMFNGGSLLVAEAAPGGWTYRVDEAVVEEIEEYRRRFDLHLGLYVQENDCDATAAALLSDLVTRRRETFSLGFAWGGLKDEVPLEGGRGDHRGLGSQRLLPRIGVAKAWTLRAKTG